jgi:hypothetical protein
MARGRGRPSVLPRARVTRPGAMIDVDGEGFDEGNNFENFAHLLDK